MSLSSRTFTELLKAAGIEIEKTQSDRREILKGNEKPFNEWQKDVLLLRNSHTVSLLVEAEATGKEAHAEDKKAIRENGTKHCG